MKAAVCFYLSFFLLSFSWTEETKKISYLFAGDTMLGSDFPSPKYLPANQGRNLFDGIKKYLPRVELFLVNLEGVIADKNTRSAKGAGKNFYSFRMHPLLAVRIKEAGISAVNLANNHGLDFGISGFKQSQAHLKKQGILASGIKNKAAYVEKKGVKIGLLGFSTSPFYNTVFELKAASRLIRSAKKDCSILIVSVHAGAEGEQSTRVSKKMEIYLRQKRGNVYAFARNAVDAGADLVIGHGPHVLRALEIYRDRLIAYSLGNFIGYGRFSTAGKKGISAVLEVQTDLKGKCLDGRVIPIILNKTGVPFYDPDKKAFSLLNRLAALDFPESGIEIDANGAFRFPSSKR